MTSVASTIDAITPEWLEGALKEAGALRDGTVVGIEHTTVGAGQLGDCHRIVPTYSGAGDEAPASVVAKLPATDPTSREFAARHQLYANEVAFYTSIAPHLGVRAPHPYLAAIEADDTNFVLLLEDLGPAHACDQISGCTPEQAVLAIEQAAAIHGPSWNRDDLLARSRLGRLATAYRTGIGDYGQLQAQFRERYADMLEPEFLDLGDRLAACIGGWVRHLDDAPCLVHVDFRLDNMLFDARAGEVPLAVVDWQSVSVGPGVADVSYFIGAGLLLEDRRRHEEELVRHYHRELCARGVDGYAWDDCWEGYQAHAVMGFVTAVNASINVKRTERGDRMFMTMARRHGTQMLDNETLSLLEGSR